MSIGSSGPAWEPARSERGSGRKDAGRIWGVAAPRRTAEPTLAADAVPLVIQLIRVRSCDPDRALDVAGYCNLPGASGKISQFAA
jgi:hypothetical protein